VSVGLGTPSSQFTGVIQKAGQADPVAGFVRWDQTRLGPSSRL